MSSNILKQVSRSKPSTTCNNELIRIVLVGKTGVGKSATGNTILGQKRFKSEFSPKSLTEHCEKVNGEVDGQKVAVIDTPGLFDTRNTEEETTVDIVQCISYASPGPHIFLVVIRLGRFTEEEKHTMEKIQEIFGEEADKYSMVLFTGGDLLKGKPIEELLKDSEDLQELVAKCNNQYHVFNNELEDRSQVSELLDKIKNINVKNGGIHYTNKIFQKVEKEIEEEKQQILKNKEEGNQKEQDKLKKAVEKKYEQRLREIKADKKMENKLRAAEGEIKDEQQQIPKQEEEQKPKVQEEGNKETDKLQQLFIDFHKKMLINSPTPCKAYNNNDLIRIVMVGKTGAGKSATGNTILGEKWFESEFTPKSLTQGCEKVYGEVHKQKVTIIDTPGLFDTKNNNEKTVKDFAQSISFAAPGPHVFLVVIKLGVYTDEEKQTVEKIQEIFGEEADKYSMVLFTHGDQLKGKTIEKFLGESKDLQELVTKYNNRYHVFNNEVKDHSQVRELFKTIRNIIEQNGESYYTNCMFQKAEEVIEEEKQRILQNKEEQNLKELEELRKKMKEDYEQQHREMEADNEKMKRLIEEHTIEMDMKVAKLKENQELLARKEAERNNWISQLLVPIFPQLVSLSLPILIGKR